MKQEVFNELLKSIQQAGKIIKGKAKPSRVFTVIQEESSNEKNWDGIRGDWIDGFDKLDGVGANQANY